MLRLRRGIRAGSSLLLAPSLGGKSNRNIPSPSRHYSLSSFTSRLVSGSNLRSDQQSLAVRTELHTCRPAWWVSKRLYCNLTEDEIRRRVEEISSLFFEARELLDDARASAGTVYFNEDMQEARTAVEEAIAEYDKLLSVLNQTQTQSVVAAIGLKIEELKAHLAAITEESDDS